MQSVSRLIQQFVPSNYQLTLSLQRTERVFTGTVIIQGSAPAAANRLAFHAKDLIITDASIDGKPATPSLHADDELHLEAPVAPGEHEIAIKFTGKITDAMHGIYPSYYEHSGVKKEIIATQFESHHAREAFPCIDEPEAKATFDVTINSEKNLTVLGNMPVKTQTQTETTLTTTFETSPRMSTYLLAFVAGELQSLSSASKSGVAVNIWATHAQKANDLQFALDVATRSIDFFNDYFGVPYPLPKADHVALPDFSAGAMENWGLITYREVALLSSAANPSLSNQQFVARVIAHEVSHQWFGNLVTMRWWDDLWLNESFASLMEYVTLDALFPEWHYWEKFTSGDSLPALQRDSIPGVQPIKTTVRHPDEINTLFDPAIVYAKGSKVLRMLRAYIGDEAFRKGLGRYFQQHAYKNTTGDDLWEAFKVASGKDTASFMQSWLEQPGFPVVSAHLQDQQLQLTQSHFQIGADKESYQLWPIPLHGTQPSLAVLFDTQKAALPIDLGQAIILNHDDTAHFITHYDEQLATRILQEITKGTINAVDRLQIINDLLLLARGGTKSSVAIVTLLPAYRNEMNASVWEILGVAISMLKRCVEQNTVAENSLRQLVRSLAITPYTALGWEPKPNEDENQTLLRRLAISNLVYAADAEVIAAALRRYTPELETIASELRPSILTAAVRHSPDTNKIVNHLLEVYATTPNGDLKDDIVYALTDCDDSATCERLISMLKTKTVRPQDLPRWFAYLIRNKYSRAATWQWLTTNWQWLEKTYAGDKAYDSFPKYAASALGTKEELTAYIEFFSPYADQPALSRIIAVGTKEIAGRVAWLERDSQAVAEQLQLTMSSATTPSQ